MFDLPDFISGMGTGSMFYFRPWQNRIENHHVGNMFLIFSNHLKHNLRTWYTLRLLWGLSMVILCFSLPGKNKTTVCTQSSIQFSTNCLSPVIQ